MGIKIFLDTSIFIRFFTKDIEELFDDCVELFEGIQLGVYKPYTSSVVLFEIFFVLTSKYGFSKAAARDALIKVIQIRNLVLIEKTDSRKALGLFEEYKVKYADCLILTQLPKQATLITYDKEFSRIEGVVVATPGQLLNN